MKLKKRTSASIGKGQISVSADYPTESGIRIIGVDTTGAPRTVTFSTEDVIKGQIFIVKDEGGNAGTNNITVATEGAETIDGAATDTITDNFGSMGYYCDGANWFKV